MTSVLLVLQFDHLDVGVQEAFEKYLDERDIGPALASFIPEFAEWKEQKVRLVTAFLVNLMLTFHRSIGVHQVAGAGPQVRFCLNALVNSKGLPGSDSRRSPSETRLAPTLYLL